LKGKILNVEKARFDKMLSSQEVVTLITALGTGIGKEEYNADKLRYHRIIIMTDADVDGSHIRTLLLTFFYRQMPELLERGHIYIAQPPLYKVKQGKNEQYIKDDNALNAYLLKLALENASIVLSDGKIIDNDQLTSLSADYQTIQNIVDRLSKTMDEGALRGIANGVRLDLDTESSANISAEGLREYFATLDSRIARPEIITQKDERTERFRLMISRKVHGNTKISVIDSDFVHGADYSSLARASEALTNVLGSGAVVKRGDSEKNAKEASVKDFREAMEWLLSEAERGVSRQRYKGLGEMNAEQLWETTMNPESRTLKQVTVESAIEADVLFSMLMGDEVAPRRDFIEKNAKYAKVDV